MTDETWDAIMSKAHEGAMNAQQLARKEGISNKGQTVALTEGLLFIGAAVLILAKVIRDGQKVAK